jgi:hypothetical protein
MKRIISTLFGLAVLCLFAEAQAVPATVSFTGRLSTSNGPVSGNVNVVFSLFNQATNGTVMWTETRNGLMAINGLVYADLGALTTLDESVLLNAPLFLEITVGGEILTPRLPLQSVPYSIRSEVANSADTLGTIAPGDVVTAVNASGGITANRSGNTVTLTGTGVAGTAPISVMAGNVSLVTCAANQVYKMNSGGTAWACSADAGTTYTGATNGGINVSGTTIGLTTCANGQVLKATATAGQWACANDTDTTNTYTNGSGLTLTGTTFATDNTVVARKDLAAGNQAFDTNVLFLDYTNNRVGVNNAAPSAGTALDVTGTVRATNFSFASPVSTSVIAHPTWCTRALSSADPHLDTEVVNPPNAFGPSISSVAEGPNTTLNFVCPVNIYVPSGATVTLTGGSMAYYDGAATCRVSAEIRSKTFGTSSSGAIASTVFDGTDATDFAATGGPTTAAFPAFTLTVAANTVVWIHATVAYNTTGGGDCRYSGAILNYTIDRP